MEEKRRLPSWMISSSTDNKANKPLDVDANDAVIVTEATKPKAKGVTRKNKKSVSDPVNENSVLVKCETKRKKRGLVEKNVIECSDHEQEIVVEKRKRRKVTKKVDESDPLKKREEKKYKFESNNECQDSSCDEDDDDDLTMDDILSIAKEFVEKDKSDKGQQKSTEEHSELKSKSSHTSSSRHDETASRHESIDNTTSKVTVSDSRTTGDPAQDMLDLLLGPLLKESITKKEVSSIKDIVIPREVKNQQRDSVISDKPVVFTKKKSSLRDAVAMLLD